jgi:hypothetical protein
MITLREQLYQIFDDFWEGKKKTYNLFVQLKKLD